MKQLWAVFGPHHETKEDYCMEVFLTEEEAEKFMASGLLRGAEDAIQHLNVGGTFSLLLTRGTGDGILMSGGWAVKNPDGFRDARDYRVVRMQAEVVP